MGQEKYSPTVSAAYRHDQEWYRKNGGDFGNGVNPDSQYDDDGYDAYGYDRNEVDREGIEEIQYLSDSIENGSYDLYFDVQSEWGFDGTKPVK